MTCFLRSSSNTMIEGADFTRRNATPSPFASVLQQQQGLLKPQGSIWQQQQRRGPAFIEQQHQDDALFNLAAAATAPAFFPISSSSQLPLQSQSPSSSRMVIRGSAPSSRGAISMRDAPQLSKIVIRHLPPTLPESVFVEQIQSRFSWPHSYFAYYPGKSSLKGNKYSRAYIVFENPNDVFKFHDAFDGHIFVNEKGLQYKCLVEYAPYQRVPKQCSKKDVRDGSIFQDPEYLEFLELLAKPVENLPSAEVQLERKEAERNLGPGAKDAIIVTPLMEYVRQKRALKPASQRLIVASGKISGRRLVSSPGNVLSRRGAERLRPGSIYVPSQSVIRAKDKKFSAHREESQRRDRELVLEKKKKEGIDFKGKQILRQKVIIASDNNASQDIQDAHVQDGDKSTGKGIDPSAINSEEIGMDQVPFGGAFGSSLFPEVVMEPGPGLTAKTKLLLKKDKEKDAGSGSRSRSPLSGDDMDGVLKTHTPSLGGLAGRHGLLALGRTPSTFVRSQGQGVRPPASSTSVPFSSPDLKHETLFEAEQSEREKRAPRRPILRATTNELSSVVGSESECGQHEGHEGRRVRNRDRPDRPVWTVRQRSDHATAAVLNPVSSIGKNSSSLMPGNEKQARRSAHGPRDMDVLASDNSKGKRGGGSSTYGEKQVWVAKSGSGT